MTLKKPNNIYQLIAQNYIYSIIIYNYQFCYLLTNLMSKYEEQYQKLTAQSWIMMDYKTNSYIRGNNINAKRQIASLTKMYTLYSCLVINQELHILPKTQYVRVFKPQDLGGTSAGLIPNKYILLQYLYYGLMLPSGNDAAWILAVYYGFWLQQKSAVSYTQRQRKEDLSNRYKHSQLYLSRFMQFMNKIIVKQHLKHTMTLLDNPHGLMSKFHYSTASQVCSAAIVFLSNPLFASIVSKNVFIGEYEDGESLQWNNTNILLEKQCFEGVKTGYTINAGNCLCSYRVKYGRNGVSKIVTVVLGCKTNQDRFKQTQLIFQSHDQYLKLMDEY